jgi:hypothetical protein
VHPLCAFRDVERRRGRRTPHLALEIQPVVARKTLSHPEDPDCEGIRSLPDAKIAESLHGGPIGRAAKQVA